jgi:hypothetical protein
LTYVALNTHTLSEARPDRRLLWYVRACLCRPGAGFEAGEKGGLSRFSDGRVAFATLHGRFAH